VRAGSARSNGVLRLRTGAASVCGICVAREFQLLASWELEHFLELGANLDECLFGSSLASCARPEANAEEALANIHDDSHDLVVALILQSLADRSELSM
jgi:hypothetical protein